MYVALDHIFRLLYSSYFVDERKKRNVVSFIRAKDIATIYVRFFATQWHSEHPSSGHEYMFTGGCVRDGRTGQHSISWKNILSIVGNTRLRETS